MDGSLGGDVPKGQALLVLIDDVSRDLAADYLAEYRFLSHDKCFLSQTGVTGFPEFAQHFD